MNRHFDPAERELIDDPNTPPADLDRALDDLISISRRFGGHRLVRHFLSRWLNPGRCYRFLDLCTGAGDLPRVMVEWARARGITLRIDAVDANPAVLELARKRSETFPEIHFHQGNALGEAPGEGYDLVHCSLSLHHFSEEDAARLLVRCRELSNRWALVSDLDRQPLTTAAIWLVAGLLYRSPVARHDGRLSARRAFSFHEMRRLAEAAGWLRFGHARFACCRQAIWLESRDLGDIPLAEVEMPSLA